MSGRIRGRARDPHATPSTRRWWVAADLVLLGGLVVLASVLLMPAYGGAAPVIATATGATIALVVLLAIDSLGFSQWWAVPGVLVGLVLVGPVVVARHQLAFGPVPNRAGMATVLEGLIGGWREMLTVATPIGVSGGLLVPPLVIGAAATVLAGLVATTNRPHLALAFPGAALVACALFGDSGAAPVAAALICGAAVAAAVAWSAWVELRAVRVRAAARWGPPAVASDAGRRALALRRMAVGACVLVIASVVGAVTAAAVDAPRVALRNVVEVPVDPEAFASPLSDFRRYSKDLADEVLLTVTGLPAGTRLRLAAVDAYDGQQFVTSSNAGPFIRIGQQRTVAATGTSVTLAVQVDGYRGPFLPVPGEVADLQFDGPRADALADDLRYSGPAATGLVPGGFTTGDSYTVTGVSAAGVLPADLAELRPSAMPFPATVVLPDALRSAASRYVTGAKSPAEQVEAIRAGLAADGVFSHGRAGESRSASGHGLDRMGLMLSGSAMVGDQEQYTALMALMVRSIGLPARVVVGFAPTNPGSVSGAGAGTSAAPTGAIDVRGSDITAWVEVPFDGVGWVAFDPSPSPDEKRPPAEPPAATERRAVAVDVPPALPQADAGAVNAESAAQNPEDTPSNDSAPITDRSGLEGALWVLAGLGAVLAVLALPAVIILAVKGARRRRRRRAPTTHAQIAGGWQQLVDSAVDAGYRPAPWHTRTETAADVENVLGLPVAGLVPEADAADFAGGTPDPRQAAGYWLRVDERTAVLLGGFGRWRRWRARLSLASMRRRPRAQR